MYRYVLLFKGLILSINKDHISSQTKVRNQYQLLLVQQLEDTVSEADTLQHNEFNTQATIDFLFWEFRLRMLQTGAQLPALIDVLFDTTSRLKLQLESNRQTTASLLERANQLKVPRKFECVLAYSFSINW